MGQENGKLIQNTSESIRYGIWVVRVVISDDVKKAPQIITLTSGATLYLAILKTGSVVKEVFTRAIGLWAVSSRLKSEASCSE